MPKFNSINDFENYNIRKSNATVKILVGMGSCGIAAGADRVYNAFKNEIEQRGLKSIELKKVGCLGLCFSEPNVEIIMNDFPDILYGRVDEKFAVRILEEHIQDKKIINENIYDKPFIDPLKL